MQKKISALFLSIIIAIAAIPAISVSADSTGDKSLKDAFADYFLMGNILEPGEIRSSTATDLVKEHFNVITAENAMKPVYVAPAKGQYNFGPSDTLVDWAAENDILVHGHTLVWHSQSAAWLTTGSGGKPLTRAEAKANMEEYITEVVTHFKGRVYSWDVVNEAFKTSVGTIPYNWMRELRTNEGGSDGSPWFMAYENGADESKGESGGDYIYDAFVFARLADPDALLYYNDYNETQSGKREAIAFMVEELNQQWKDDPRNTEPDRLLIEGIGMQAHYFTEDSNLVSNVEATIKRFARTGADVVISELDIPLGNWQTYKNRDGELSAEEEQLQADFYKELFEVFVRNSESISRVSLWGKADNQSWRRQGYPLIFAKDYVPKKAYYEILGIADIAHTLVETTAPPKTEATESESANDEFQTVAEEIPIDNSTGLNIPILIIIAIGVVAIIVVVVAAVIMRTKR